MTETQTNSRLDEVILRSAAEICESVSLNRVAGQIYALLYFRAEPVSMDEIVEKLDSSKGSVSNNIRFLEEWDAVKKIAVPGSQKDFYTAEPDFMKIVMVRLEQGLERRVRIADEKFREIQSLVRENGDGKSRSFILARLKKLEEIKDLAAGALKFLPLARNLGGAKMLASFLKK